MDDIDRAQDREAKDREMFLAHRKPQLTPKGIYYNCLDPVPETAEFCNAECREDYELREAARLREGR